MTNRPALSQVEFVALLAFCVSLTALSIDAMLPALNLIAGDLRLADVNDSQLIVGVQFAGMTIGQLVAGPISDSWGRKPAMYGGLAIFAIGSVMAMVANSFPLLLVGRALQGAGASSPRVVSAALVRDQYSGASMARVMSLVATVFIIVPVIAPIIGQVILLFASWRAIFGFLLLQGLIAMAWFGLRQPETLTVAKRRVFSLRDIGSAGLETLKNRVSLGYMLVAGLSSGGFVAYLSTSRQILQDQYGVGKLFPLYFAILALAIGSASLVNSRLVEKLGMSRLCVFAQTTLTCVALAFSVIAYLQDGHPPLWQTMGFFMAVFFCLGILFGNSTAKAMEPLGHIAGTASAVISAVTTLISSSFGIYIGRRYDGTILPIVIGFAVLGIFAQLVLRWAERPEKVVPHDKLPPPPVTPTTV